MLATLARCVPQDFVNPFVSAATLPTMGVALLTVWVGAFWLLPMFFPRLHAARLGRITVLSTIAIAPVAAVTLWIWLQARSFISWCAPINTGVLDAQYRNETVALVVGFVAFVFAILVIMGSTIAATVANLRRD